MSERRLKNEWEVSAFDREKGEWTTALNHSWEVTPDGADIENLLVSRAAPTTIRPSKRKKPSRRDERTLVAGDAQIPFQDDTAMADFQSVVYETQPDNIVLVGDMIDLPSVSKYTQRPEWAGSTQAAIDDYHNFLAQLRTNAPNARLAVVHGNHEQRMDDYVRRNAMEVLGLRRANMGQELAVLTLQYLVRYDDLEVESIDGYPNGTLWLEDNLKLTHGTNTQKGGTNAAKYLREERETTIYGHSHRQELAYRTYPQRIGAVTIAAASPGCLALTDGSVPGFNHTVDAQGVTVPKSEDWQQGLLVIDHNATTHHITPVRFTEDGYMLDGKHYERSEA